MKIKSLTTLALITTTPVITAQSNQQPLKRLEDALTKKCDDTAKFIEDILSNKKNEYHAHYKNRRINTKNTDLPKKCKTDTMLLNADRGTLHEGRECYLKDKLEKANKGGIVIIEKRRLLENLENLIKSPTMSKFFAISENDHVFIMISPDNAIKENQEIFDIFHQNHIHPEPAIINFALADKEVPDFDNAIFSLKRRAFFDKIPAKIIKTAVESDDNLSKSEKKLILTALNAPDTYKYMTFTDKTLKNAVDKTLRTISEECHIDDQYGFVKGISLTKSSSYEMYKWDNTALKDWVANKIKQEL